MDATTHRTADLQRLRDELRGLVAILPGQGAPAHPQKKGG